jgi:pimeloyl-ACP methyl ester carboxylesterase
VRLHLRLEEAEGPAAAGLGAVERQLPRVAAPVLVVRGTRDRIVPQAWAERAARLLPRGRLAVIPGAAHAVNFSYPREFKAAMLPFLLGDEETPASNAVAWGTGARQRPGDGT